MTVERQPRLGFAIPTYRRPALLDLALKSMVPQAKLLSAPIFISDNSCDQTNVAVVNRWKTVYPCITHHINNENIGIDRNVDQAITQCPAEYVHVIGDDDILLPDFATNVLATLDRSSPGHIICSYIYLANDYRSITGKPVIPANAKTDSMRSFVTEYGWTLGFIGAHVFNRKRFQSASLTGFGTYFHHLLRLLEYLDPDEPIGFVAEPLVGNRADDESTASWSADRLAVVFGLEEAFVLGMNRSYEPSEIQASIDAARRDSGYTQYFRLLYWGALADAAGNAPQYWQSLKPRLHPTAYARLRAVPRFVYPLIRTMIPLVRRTKRYAKRQLHHLRTREV